MAVVNFLGRASEGLCVYRKGSTSSEALGNERRQMGGYEDAFGWLDIIYPFGEIEKHSKIVLFIAGTNFKLSLFPFYLAKKFNFYYWK